MTTGLQADGSDLDTIFKSRVSTKIGNVDIDASGVDISNLFEKYRTFATKVPATGWKSGGTDLKDLFLSIDQALVGGDWPWSDVNITDTVTSGTASAYMYFGTAGTCAIYQNGASSGQTWEWLDLIGTGNGNDFYVKYTLNSGDAPTYLGMVGGTFSTSYNPIVGNFYIGFQNVTDKEANITISIAESSGGVNEVSWTGQIKALYDPPFNVLWTSTAGTAAKTEYDAPPGDVVLSWGAALTMTINADGSSNLDSPFASDGANTDFQIKWVLVSTTGVGAGVTPVAFNENTWYDLSQTRQLQFSGDQAGNIIRVVVVDVTIRINGDASSEVTKRITVNTENVI
jgi:hypothetical protein